uniref:t-SNARE coiled-coil homology domain-containing protein n=1 Tax=Taeniopygia guttata TaxID=59729 RepID=A0A674GDE8_TAEGU
IRVFPPKSRFIFPQFPTFLPKSVYFSQNPRFSPQIRVYFSLIPIFPPKFRFIFPQFPFFPPNPFFSKIPRFSPQIQVYFSLIPVFFPKSGFIFPQFPFFPPNPGLFFPNSRFFSQIHFFSQNPCFSPQIQVYFSLIPGFFPKSGFIFPQFPFSPPNPFFFSQNPRFSPQTRFFSQNPHFSPQIRFFSQNRRFSPQFSFIFQASDSDSEGEGRGGEGRLLPPEDPALAQAQYLRSALGALSLRAAALERLQERALATPLPPPELQEDLQRVRDEIQDLTREIQAGLRGLEPSGSDSGPGSVRERLRRTQHGLLAQQFFGVTERLQTVQSRYRQRNLERIQRQLQIAGHAPLSEEELEQLLESGQTQIFVPNAAGAARAALDEAGTRHREIRRLERGLRELGELFRLLGSTVEAQGDVIDRIERHVQDSGAELGKGRSHLRGAGQRRRGARKVNWFILGGTGLYWEGLGLNWGGTGRDWDGLGGTGIELGGTGRDWEGLGGTGIDWD